MSLARSDMRRIGHRMTMEMIIRMLLVPGKMVVIVRSVLRGLWGSVQARVVWLTIDVATVVER